MPVRARKLLLIILPVVITVFLFAYFLYVFNYEAIYPGVKISGLSVQKLKKDAAINTIRDKFPYDGQSIAFEYNKNTFSLLLNESGVGFDYKKSVDNAYSYGRKGNIFVRLKDIISSYTKGANIPLELSIDINKLERVMKDNLADFVSKNTENKIELNSDRISVTNGKEGMGIDMAYLLSEIRSNLSHYDLYTPNNVKISMIKPKHISYETLKNLFEAEKKDFEYYQKNGHFLYTPSTVGVSIDKELCESILKNNSTNDLPYEIPVKLTYPQKNIRYFSDNYIIDTLGSFSTVYNNANIPRSENIRIAASKINGCLIEPGGVFSFNKVVGKRDEQSGFKTAKVYQSGEVVDGVGGGICQVSSTLFNAVLFAVLEIVKRTNHSMPVTYVAVGRDATVSYDYIDFAFKNNKSYPIRIDCFADNGNITCSVMGINEDNKVVEITTEIIKRIPYGTKTKKTSSLYEGKTKVLKAGQEGVRVNTYKTVSINGVKMERQWVCESYYAPVDALVEVGTKKKPLPKTAPPSPPKIQEKSEPIAQTKQDKIIQYPLPQ